MYKVIFHLNDLNNYNQVFNNTKNLIKEFDNNKKNYHIIILINGNAVNSLLDDLIINNIKALQSDNVMFNVCSNSLKANKIDQSNLIKELIVVSSGVYTLTIKQSEGYLYIKP